MCWRSCESRFRGFVATGGEEGDEKRPRASRRQWACWRGEGIIIRRPGASSSSPRIKPSIQWGNEKSLDSIPSPFPSPLTTNPTLDRYRCYPHIRKRARLLKKGNFYAQEQNRKMCFASPLPPPTTQTQTPAHSPAPWPASPSSSPCSGTRAEAACQSTYKTLAGAHWVPSPPRAAAPQT